MIASRTSIHADFHGPLHFALQYALQKALHLALQKALHLALQVTLHLALQVTLHSTLHFRCRFHSFSIASFIEVGSRPKNHSIKCTEKEHTARLY